MSPQLLSRQCPVNQFLPAPVGGQQLDDDFLRHANQSWQIQVPVALAEGLSLAEGAQWQDDACDSEASESVNDL